MSTRKMTLASSRPLGIVVLAIALVSLLAGRAEAKIDGISGPSFTLTAKTDYISTADGGSYLLWGYADGAGRAQYPGPTLILAEGQRVTITLQNQLPVPVSIVFPGHGPVTATGGTPGLLTREAEVGGGPVTYTFIAGKPGTYLYHSGTRPELEIEMGLVGAIIVRPSGWSPAAPTAYHHPGSAYDREFLFLLSEMDPIIHDYVAFFDLDELLTTRLFSSYFPNYWFINGRTAMDTMLDANAPGCDSPATEPDDCTSTHPCTCMPTQPYNSMPMMRPGDRVLMRVIGAGRQTHPFHHHGNHARVIARNGRLLDTGTTTGLPDLSTAVFTIQSVPGQTVDAIFEWTGKGMGWDVYGTATHGCKDVVDNRTGLPVAAGNPYAPGDGYADLDADHPWEWCPDHGHPLPVTLPAAADVTPGPFFGGGAFLGVPGPLPPGQGGLNPSGAYNFMWHSHDEKELCNYGVFPGGMMTMMMIHPDVMPE